MVTLYNIMIETYFITLHGIALHYRIALCIVMLLFIFNWTCLHNIIYQLIVVALIMIYWAWLNKAAIWWVKIIMLGLGLASNRFNFTLPTYHIAIPLTLTPCFNLIKLVMY